MTKQFLAALLIAGLSATAKAEPTVYYCNTTKFADVDKDEIQKIRSYPFKLFVDLKNSKIKVAGEIANFEASGAQVIPWTLRGKEYGVPNAARLSLRSQYGNVIQTVQNRDLSERSLSRSVALVFLTRKAKRSG